MSKLKQIALVAFALTGLCGPAFAGKDRCRVEINGEWHWLPRTFTRGGCEVEAKRRVCLVRCIGGAKEYGVTYQFDDLPFSTTGRCGICGR
jgi:hypothetical protein